MRISAGFVAAVSLVWGGLTANPGSAEQGKGGFVTSPEVAAAQNAARDLQLQIVERHRSGQSDPDYFGTDCCQIMQIPAAAFSPFDGAVAAGESTLGYLYASAFGGFYDFWAPVILPTGARIVFLDLYYYDTSVSADFIVELRALSGGSAFSGPPAGSTVASVSSTDSSGYGYAATQLDYRVNNSVNIHSGAQLILRTSFVFPDGSQRFKGVDIWWRRDVSPAPGTATFPDVPTSDFGFQFVEALAASSITGGCGGGNYCPDDPVTRRQMAIFIAKALGLHWPF